MRPPRTGSRAVDGVKEEAGFQLGLTHAGTHGRQPSPLRRRSSPTASPTLPPPKDVEEAQSERRRNTPPPSLSVLPSLKGIRGQGVAVESWGQFGLSNRLISQPHPWDERSGQPQPPRPPSTDSRMETERASGGRGPAHPRAGCLSPPLPAHNPNPDAHLAVASSATDGGSGECLRQNRRHVCGYSVKRQKMDMEGEGEMLASRHACV